MCFYRLQGLAAPRTAHAAEFSGLLRQMHQMSAELKGALRMRRVSILCSGKLEGEGTEIS